MSTQPFPAMRSHNRLLVVGLGLLAIVTVALTALDISQESYKRPIFVVLLLVQSLTALRNWRLSVYLFLGYVLIEGFVINYFSGQPELNLVKDFQLGTLFLLLCAGTLARHLSPFPLTPWMYALLGFAGIYFLSAFNPALPTVMVGLIGVRVTLVFMLCIAVAYWFFRTTDDVYRFLKVHTLFSLPISAFGIVQYFTGPELLLRMSPGFSRAIFYAYTPGVSESATYFRAISTFASTAGFSQYMCVSVILTWAYYLVAKTKKAKWMAVTALLLQMGGMMASGGRAPLILALVALFIGYALMRRLARGLIAGVLVTAIVGVILALAGGPIAARFATILDLESANERNRALVVGQFMKSMDSPVEGIGAGQLTAAAGRLSGYRPELGVENQFARIRYESGVAGLFLFVLAVGMMSYAVARIALLLRHPLRRTVGGLAAGYFIVLVMIMPMGMPLDVPPTNFYFWFLIGMLHALARDDQRENAAMAPPLQAGLAR